MQNDADQNLLRLPDVARRLSVSLRTVHALLATGDLEFVKIRGATRVRESAVQYLIAACSTRRNPRRSVRRQATKSNITTP